MKGSGLLSILSQIRPVTLSKDVTLVLFHISRQDLISRSASFQAPCQSDAMLVQLVLVKIESALNSRLPKNNNKMKKIK